MVEKLKHLVDSRDLDKDRIEEIFKRTPLMRDLEEKYKTGIHHPTAKKSVCLIFEEPSNITWVSFIQAINFLAWNKVDYEVPKESMWPTSLQNEAAVFKNLSVDLFILRSHEIGRAAQAAEYSEIPIINAGESFTANAIVTPSQHPTQALIDLYTIRQHFDTLDGLKYVFVGDLRSNPVVNSMLFNLRQFQPGSIVLVSKAGSNQIHRDIEAYLAGSGIPVTKTKDPNNQLQTADVVYLAEPKYPPNHPDIYKDTIEEEDLNLLPEHSVVLDAMLRGEIPPFRYHPRMRWQSQLQNAIPVRMALLDMLATD